MQFSIRLVAHHLLATLNPGLWISVTWLIEFLSQSVVHASWAAVNFLIWLMGLTVSLISDHCCTEGYKTVSSATLDCYWPFTVFYTLLYYLHYLLCYIASLHSLFLFSKVKLLFFKTKKTPIFSVKCCIDQEE